MLEGGCPSKDRSFGHIRQHKCNLLGISGVNVLIYNEVEGNSVEPGCGFGTVSVKSLQEQSQSLTGHEEDMEMVVVVEEKQKVGVEGGLTKREWLMIGGGGVWNAKNGKGSREVIG